MFDFYDRGAHSIISIRLRWPTFRILQHRRAFCRSEGQRPN